MKILLLRFDAPLMSFGGVMIDQHGPTERFPAQSQITGMLANALGYRHGDADRLNSLQDRLRFAARWDVAPVPFRDYQTVDLGQDKMREPGWTTHGRPEHRDGGEAKYGTHQRYRHYWADGVMTLAVTMIGSTSPSITELGAALQYPARPLYIGRKACLPACPIHVNLVEASDVLQALTAYPREDRHVRRSREPAMEARWPAGLHDVESSRLKPVYDLRDWANQIHVGRQLRREGLIEEEKI